MVEETNSTTKISELIITQNDGWISKLRSFITKKEPLTKKLAVGLSGCTNGDRGMVVTAICNQDKVEDRQNYTFILIGLFITIVVPMGLNFLFQCLGNLM